MVVPVSEDRLLTQYENLSDVFSKQNTDYKKQYSSIYLIRLKQMEGFLNERIKRKWNNKYPICQLHKLTETNYDKCVVIGTLFKDQKLKPSVLKQLAESNQLVAPPIVTHFSDDSDVLYMEDELQRYKLLGNISAAHIVTGITCALLGSDCGKGDFMVDDYLFAGYAEQIPRPLVNKSMLVCFLSGLDFVNHAKLIQQLFAIRHYISESEVVDSNRIVRIIIAGNSVRTEVQKKSSTMLSMTARVAESNDTIEAVQSFDEYLSDLCKVINVDVMPGENDPSNYILPQKPMHYCMFPRAGKQKTLNLVSNPYYCSLDGIRIFGTSGQPINDILRYSDVDNGLDALENCLKWNHWAPTAPDTLGCFPFYEKDPFIINDCPHVVFAGNQKQFETRIVNGDEGQTVRLICVPEFVKSSQAVLLDLKTLECSTIKFDISL